MNSQYSLRGRWRALVVVLLATVCVAAVAIAPALATPPATDQLKALDTSLNLVPGDVAFYSSMLRNDEQVEVIAGSRAWAKFLEMPVMQTLRQMVEGQIATPGSKAAELKMYLENPQTQYSLGLLADMFSNDVFVYGDADVVDSFELMQEIATAMRYGPPMLQISGQMKGLDENQVKAMLLMAVLAENADRVKVPGIVFGFKVKNTNRAIEHIGKLDLFLGFALANQGPELAEALQHTSIDGHNCLVLTLTGDMIPWDQIPLEDIKELELEEGIVDKLVEKLKKEKLVITVGMRDDYLVVSIGSSTEPLVKLGKTPGLVTRPEMAPLARFADERLTSIDYVSKEFMETANGGERQIDDLMDFVDQILPKLELTEDEATQIRKDAKELAKTIKQKMPVVGAVSGVSFLSDRGIESFNYNWGTQPGLDGTKALGLLTHVGGSPILAVVSRSKISLEDYDLAIKWLKKGYGYFREYGVPNLDEGDREEFEKVAKSAEPILAHLDRTNREKLLPALDGQFGLVVDGKLTSKQFLKTLPATDQSMPMAEPAVVLGLRDADLMRGALVQYWDIIRETVGAAAEINSEVDEAALPEPEVIDATDGELFVFVPPEACPVDPQITPNVGLGNGVCVFSMSQAHTERLLKTTPLSVGGVLGDPDQPMAVAVVFDWAGLLRAGRPWIELGVEKVLEARLGPGSVGQKARTQVRTAIELLSVFRSVTSKAYFENGTMVIHTLVEIRDVD
ncbi:MAG: hypothetical protein JW888_13470 [Pirellulales bacterium]|nr:hypothetical protein [Pirellulales bacterium]